jgi:hypothetical protein
MTLHHWLATSFCAVCLALAPLPADAQAKAASKPSAKTSGSRLKAPPKVTYADGQTPAQRQRSEQARLRRECKGRPNAGACRGHTR